MKRSAAVILGAVCLALAGCGGDDEPGESNAPVNTETPAQPEGTTPAPAESGRGPDDGSANGY